MSMLQILSRYTSCDVSDALVNFGIKNGGCIPNLVQRSSGSTINSTVSAVVGPAYTVLYAPMSDPRPAVKASYIDEIPKDHVLVIGLTENQQLTGAPYVTVNNALYGGLMSTRAKYRGASGSIILGRIRDLDEHRDLNYPVWSYGVGTTAPGPVVKVVGINVELKVKVFGAGPSLEASDLITIRPQDWIIADENGVVRIPISHDSGAESGIEVEKVLDYIPKRVEADRKVSEDIKNGRGAAESQKYWRGKI